MSLRTGIAEISGRQYQLLQKAFDYFNDCLFSQHLPQVLLTLHRKRSALGYFSSACFTLRDGNEKQYIHEIAINPDYFSENIPTKRILSTLVHEMAHLWQQEFGRKRSHGYHNKEWANKMESIGLMPSTSGLPGGKRTGKNCSHYVIKGGRFDFACAVFIDNYGDAILVNSLYTEKKEKSAERVRKVEFLCPDCQQQAWAHADASLICGLCATAMGQYYTSTVLRLKLL